MKRTWIIGLFLFCLCIQTNAQLEWRGQASTWGLLHPESAPYVGVGLRYIPELSFQKDVGNGWQLDAEAALHAHVYWMDHGAPEGILKPYRLWLRATNAQWELRAGLQKINFGSAQLFRPLMWFDQVDPVDPLQLTDGVWAMMGRYVWLNNANVWLWALPGGQDKRLWDLEASRSDVPELGGRLQLPLRRGEMAASVHHRVLKGTEERLRTSETRVGLDGRLDLGLGLWYEATWMGVSRNVGLRTQQIAATVGADYTLPLGNGLGLMAEQLFYTYGTHLNALESPMMLTALSVSYPVDIQRDARAMVYYEPRHSSVFGFLMWGRTWDALRLHALLYSNPSLLQLPVLQSSTSYFAGSGIQVTLIWNH